MNNTLFIAIDAGKDSTKFVYHNAFNLQRDMFRTKVQEVENLGVDVEHNTFMIEFNDKNYLIGDMVNENKLSFDLSKKSIEHKLAIYVAISKVIKKHPSIRIKIAVGAPLSIYKNATLKEEYRDYILNNGFVSMTINKETVRFNIDDVLILPESIGPIYTSLNDYRNTRATIIDIGGLNSNICRFNNLVPDLNSMLVANKGGNVLKSKIADALSREYGVILYKDDVEQILKDDGILFINGTAKKGSKELIKKIMKEHLKDIISFAKQNELDIFNSNGKVVFCRGGSLLLKKVIQETYPHATISPDSQFVNAMSFYKVLLIKNGQA
ncbi:hypothetical protein ACFIJ5_07550 [Haloimpatiens sp. FM7330]|uniref:ParM/StbA family protein n=1 Tax=Haloimpatiens sp. FM7330 TaxID=3298610 RepID=UPI00362828CA